MRCFLKMTIQPKNKEGINDFSDLNKFFQNKHIILVFISRRNKDGYFFIVNDIVDEFELKLKYAQKLVKELESEKSIKKGIKIEKNGVYHVTYTLTETAKTELKNIARIIENSL